MTTSLPNGPKTPALLQQLQWISRPLDYLETNGKKYGETFTAHLDARHWVMLSNPQAIQALFALSPQQIEVGKYNKTLRPLVGAQSLFLIDGNHHQQQRQLLTPPFHGERMRAYGQLICEITKQVSDQWQMGQPFSVRPFMQDISLQVILNAVFGLAQGDRYEELRHLIIEMMDAITSPLGSTLLLMPSLQQDWGAWSPWGKFLRRQQQIDDLLYAEIRDRREDLDPNRTDILTLLISARDTNGEGMSDQELHDELLTLLLAGYETTASAISWALYWIHRLPTVREKLLAELNQVSDVSDLSAIARLPYFNAVCQETLRYYPVALLTLARSLKVPLKIADQEFAPGTILVGCIYLLHQREDLYPDPQQFKPERFLERQFSPYEYIPFGGGNRRCIGMALAQFEMKLVLATLLSRYQLAMVTPGEVKPVRRGVTLAPPPEMQMVVTGLREGNPLKSLVKA